MTALNMTIPPLDSPATPKRSLMSRLWPVASRQIDHRTFGALKPWRNGNYLRGKSDFKPLNKFVWIVIRNHGDSGPSPLQEKLFLQIEKHFSKVLPRVLRELFVEYQKVRQLPTTGISWPMATKPSDLLKIIPLDAIWLEEGPGHPFVFSFQSQLDKDHEFHVFFRHGKLESVAYEN